MNPFGAAMGIIAAWTIMVWIWGILGIVALIWVILDVMKRNELKMEMKLLWILIALLLPIIGAVIYYFVGRKK